MKTRTLILTGILTSLLSWTLPAADAVKYEAKPVGSEMKLDGDSTVHKWTCIGKIIGGSFEVEQAWQKDPTLKSVTCLGPGKTPPKCEARIPIRSLKSQVAAGASVMDARMQAEMKAKEFPAIVYTLTELTLKGEVPASGSPVTFEATGNLAISGSTNKVTFPITMERVGSDGLKFTGSYESKMTAFGIKPPEFTILGVGMKSYDPIKMTWTWEVGIKKD